MVLWPENEECNVYLAMTFVIRYVQMNYKFYDIYKTNLKQMEITYYYGQTLISVS